MPIYKSPDFRALPPGLASIFDRADQSSFFALRQWYDLMMRFGTSDPGKVRVYSDERQASMAAILLQESVENGCCRLRSLANFYSIEHGPIAHGADRTEGVEAILSQLDAERPRWDSLMFSELDPRDPSCNVLTRSLSAFGWIVRCTPGSATWYENTDGLNFTEYLAARPSSLRNTWRRKLRRIRSSGRLSKAFFYGVSEIERGIADYQAIYAASWKPPEPFPHFIPELIRCAAGLGALRLGVYYVDDIPAAAQFWIVWQGQAIIYKLAHDQRFDDYSLGTLLTMDMIERVLEQDRPYEINLGRGDDPYKKLWLPKRRERWNIEAANPRTIRGLRLALRIEAAKLYHRLRNDRIAPAI